ncbi:MAG: DUF2179 domain-containing protein [Pirellulales bacterium]
MMLLGLAGPQGFWLPLVIFFAELTVVTLGTIRIIFVSRGMKRIAPAIGFFEIVIWLFAMSQIMRNLTEISCYMAFAGGFTVGSYLGILIPEKLALGTMVVRIITKRDAAGLIANLRSANFGVTAVNGHGATGPVQIVFTIVKRKELHAVVALIHQFDTAAFYSVDELQMASHGVFPRTRSVPTRVFEMAPPRSPALVHAAVDVPPAQAA